MFRHLNYKISLPIGLTRVTQRCYASRLIHWPHINASTKIDDRSNDIYGTFAFLKDFFGFPSERLLSSDESEKEIVWKKTSMRPPNRDKMSTLYSRVHYLTSNNVGDLTKDAGGVIESVINRLMVICFRLFRMKRNFFIHSSIRWIALLCNVLCT